MISNNEIFCLKPSMRGFTLIEVILVIGLSVVLIGAFSFLGAQTIRNQEFERAEEIIKSEIFDAQAKSISGTDDSNWGVAFMESQIISFRGSSYVGRDTRYDNIVDFSDAVIISGASEVVFNRIDGGTLFPITLTISAGGRTGHISVNTHGAISLQ